MNLAGQIGAWCYFDPELWQRSELASNCDHASGKQRELAPGKRQFAAIRNNARAAPFNAVPDRVHSIG